MTSSYSGASYETRYDESGNVLTVTGPLGPKQSTAKNIYDQYGRLHEVYQDAQYDYIFTEYVYDSIGQLERVIDPVSAETVSSYDKLGRLERVDGELSSFVQYVYDAVGNVRRELSSSRADVINTYDGRNQLVREEFAPKTGEASIQRTMGYDPNGNLSWATDFESNQTDYNYDALNYLDKVTAPDPGTGDHGRPVTDYDYFSDGLLESVTDPRNRTTSYVYDLLDRVTYTLAPNGTTTNDYSSYLSPAGLVNQVETTDVLSRHSIVRSDPYGRRVQTVLPDPTTGVASGPSLSWKYDVRGNLEYSIDEFDRLTKYVYDDFDRVFQVQSGVNGRALKTESTLLYYADSTLESDTSLGGMEVVHEYDTLKRVLSTTVDSGGATSVTSWKYNVFGEMYQYTSPVSDVTTYAYTPFGQLRHEKIVIDGVEMTRGYEYDDNGSLDYKEDRNGVQTTYGYDHLNRLVSELSGSGSSAYSASYHYYVDNSLQTASDIGRDNTHSSFNYTYDTRGNLDQVSLNNSSIPQPIFLDYGFDNGRQLRSQLVAAAGVPLVDKLIEYDQLGRVVSYEQSGTAMDGHSVVYEYLPFDAWNPDFGGNGKVNRILRFDTATVPPQSALGHYTSDPVAKTDFFYDLDEQLRDRNHLKPQVGEQSRTPAGCLRLLLMIYLTLREKRLHLEIERSTP